MPVGKCRRCASIHMSPNPTIYYQDPTTRISRTCLILAKTVNDLPINEDEFLDTTISLDDAYQIFMFQRLAKILHSASEVNSNPGKGYENPLFRT